MAKSDKSKTNRSRRVFLQAVGASVPTLSLVVKEGAARGASSGLPHSSVSSKFTPVDLTRFFQCSPKAFGPRERVKDDGLWRNGGDSVRDGLTRMPTGRQSLRGLPFWLGPEGIERKSWLLISTRKSTSAASTQMIPIGKKATFVCLAAFCDWDQNEAPPDQSVAPPPDVVEKVGQHLARMILVYEDGSEQPLSLRRRFEVNPPAMTGGHLAFAALPHRKHVPRRLTDSLQNASGWGPLQPTVSESPYSGGPSGTLWISALANPHPERAIKSIRFEAQGEDPLVVCGLTLFRGRENPLRHERLTLYRVTLPEATANDQDRWKLDVDLGAIARTYVLGEFSGDNWLTAPGQGLGERAKPMQGARHLYAEVTASSEATLALIDAKTGRRYEFELDQVAPGKELEARPAGARVEILEREKTWVHGQVIDPATAKPVARRKVPRSIRKIALVFFI